MADNSFEVIFNIDAKDKFYFGDLNISLPDDFQPDYNEINELFVKLKMSLIQLTQLKK